MKLYRTNQVNNDVTNLFLKLRKDGTLLKSYYDEDHLTSIYEFNKIFFIVKFDNKSGNFNSIEF